MASTGQYFILHPENFGVTNMAWFLLTDSLIDSGFIETDATTDDSRSFKERLLIVLAVTYLKVASTVADGWKKLTLGLEYTLNYVSLNGGLLGLVWRTLSGSVKTPVPEEADYRSIRNFLDGRAALDKRTAAMVKYVPLDDLENGFQEMPTMELAVNASTLAYENEEHIKDAVNNSWGMMYEEFFECYNPYLKSNETEAFVFCDKATDPQLIVIAFRGTQFQLNDWEADLEFSWINTKVMGNVHIGFMRSLGLQSDTNFAEGFPAEYTGTLNLAYYSIRKKVSELAQQYTNARIVVTGHSLGGALAVLFTSLLAYHGCHDLLDKIQNVYTFGQPRVGDETFGVYMASVLGDRYIRMVYRYDLVPRVPFNFPILMTYKHFGSCLVYNGWYEGTIVTDMPDNNYFFDIVYLPIVYWGYFVDLWRCFWLLITRGIWEGLMATLYRIICVILPGVVFHSCGNYVKSVSWAKVSRNSFKD